MIELRFHRELYLGTAIDEAMKVFSAHAQFEQAEEPTHWVVRLTAKDAAREKRIANELSNYALGLTIKSSEAS
ncbi:MAG: HxsD-like protein [Polyangiales bacterium]